LQRDPEAVDLASQRDTLEKSIAENQKLLESSSKEWRDAQSEVAKYGDVSTAPAQEAPPGVSEASIRADGKARGKSAAAIERAVQNARKRGWIK
jgi:hypothetical protein